MHPALAISQMTTYRWSFFEDVFGYQQAGVNSMAAWRPKLVDFGEERSADLLAECGMAVSSLNWAGGFTGANGYTFKEAVDDVREAIRTAARIGARVLTIISGARAGHIRSHARRLLIEGVRASADDAAELGVRLALQPMHRLFHEEWTFLHSLSATLDLLAHLDHPYVGMAFGTYHLWQEPALLDKIPAAVPYITVAQLSDWRDPPRCDNDRLPPGEGIIPLEAIVETLQHSGYDGPYEVEVWSADLWKTDYHELLSRCCRASNDLLAVPV